MAGKCTVCVHSKRRAIDAYMKTGTNFANILKWLQEQNRKDGSVLAYATKIPLRRHRVVCLGLPPLMAGMQRAGWKPIPPPPESNPVSDVEITERARAILAGKLDELSAKELHALVLEGLKTQRAEAAARAKERVESDEDDDAKDDLRGALVAIK